VHHTVAHAGGFDEPQLRQLFEGAGLAVSCFLPDAFTIDREVELPDELGGGRAQMQFPAFMAIGRPA
jgi:hypothetical protein